jgi:hypothetical protein
MLGSVVGALVHAMEPEALRSWGWRVPFLTGIVVGLLGLHLQVGGRVGGRVRTVVGGEHSPVGVTVPVSVLRILFEPRCRWTIQEDSHASGRQAAQH